MEHAANYAYRVWVEKSFSAAAKSLFVSQPALSATVARLEADLGFRIFDRSTVPLSLTPAGRIYIESLEEIMESERHMRRRIRQLTEIQSETLSIGGNNFLAYTLFPVICSEFTKRHPDVRLRLDLGSSKSANNLHDELKHESLDLLLAHTFDSREEVALSLLEERMIVAMNRHLPGAEALAPYAVSAEELLGKRYSQERELEDFSLFRRIPFFRFRKGSLTYQDMAKILGDYAACPHVIAHASNSGMHYAMMSAGLGALLTTDAMVAASPMPTEDLLFFVPKCPESHRSLYLLRKAGLPENPIVTGFLETARELAESGRLLPKLL